MNSVQFWTRATVVFVIAAWCVFALIFLLRKKPKEIGPPAKRDPAAFWGIFLKGLAYGMVWYAAPRRAGTRPMFDNMPLAGQIAIALLAAVIATASVWLVLIAVRTLGKQWAVQARLIEGHRLIVEGPYRWVRNPIYTGMFGMLIATGLAFATWPMLLGGIVLYLIGFTIRVRAEEKLLQAQFGEEFEAYKRQVPALLPRL